MNVNLLKKPVREIIYFCYIVSFMILVPVCELICQCDREMLKYPGSSVPVILNAYGILGAALCIVSLFFKLRNKEIYPSDVFFLLLIFFALVSLIFTKQDSGYDTAPYIGERPLYFMAYFSLFFAAAALNDISIRKKVLYAYLIVSAINSFVSIPQSFGKHLPGSTTGVLKNTFCYGLAYNSNWFAGLTIILVAACAGMLIFTKKGSKLRLLYLVLTILAMYVSFCTKTRISLLGNTAIVCFYVISFIVMRIKGYDRDKLRSHIIAFIVVIACYALVASVIAVTRMDFKQMTGEFQNDANSVTNNFDSFGGGRGYIWRSGVEAIPHYWLTGTGLDNFDEVFTSDPEWHEGMFISYKAHSEYLNIFVTQGVFSGINYIALIVYVSVISVKNIINTEDSKERFISWILLGMVAGYAAQAFVNSSMPNVAPYFWIALGMCVHTSVQTPIRSGRKKNSQESA